MTFHLLSMRSIGTWSLIALLAGISVFAQTEQDSHPPLPSWLSRKSDLLPNVTVDEFMKMEQSWPKLQLEHSAIFNPPPEYWVALRTVAELGEKAVQALVWLYAQDAPRLKPSAGVRKSYLIETVFLKDTTSSRWVLPLLRYRLQWIEGLLDRGEHEQLARLSDELGAIQGYMNIRGDEQDYRKVMDLIAKLAASNEVIKKELHMLLGADYDAAADESRRRSRRQQLFPYQEWAKLALASHDSTAKQSEKNPSQLNDFNVLPSSVIQPPAPKKAPEAKAVTTSEEPTSSTPRLVWAVLIVAAISLLWLLLKNRK